jgi:hypothetical protein
MAEEEKEKEKVEEDLSGEEPEGEEKEETHDEKKIASRGIPSKDSLYLPPHNSPELRAFQDGNENITRNAWNIEEVANFVFPVRYQEQYHEAALGFLRLLLERNTLSGDEIGSFVSRNGISKATFYNRVLPRLRRVGMIKVERQTLIALESKRKFRPMAISLSKTFGNYLTKIGDSWLAVVDDARSRKEKK